MRRFLNPWRNIKGFQCFGCSAHNPIGLKMEFEEGEDGLILCHWRPTQYYQGWIGVIHGGIQATMMDEIAEWVIVHDLHCTGVTAKLDIKYIKPLESTNQNITIKAKLKKKARQLAWIDAWIENDKKETCAKAEALYYCYPEAKEGDQYYIGPLEFDDNDNTQK